jgi:aldose 1-epimerase
MDVERFGTLPDGRAVRAATIRAGGLRARVLTLGATLNAVRLDGVAHDLTLGADRVEDYLGPMRFHGGIVGPVANRVTGSAVTIEGATHALGRPGDAAPLLHSGAAGTHAKLWQIAAQGPDALRLTLGLPAGEAGFPGARILVAAFRVLPPATLRLTLTAETDAPTPLNLANHSYWNLDGTADWTGHRLRIAADRVLSHHGDGRVRGPVLPVGGTARDFRRGRALHPDAPALDHCFVLADARRALTEAAALTGRSGVTLRLATTEPGLQVYDGRAAQRPGRGPREGVALEPQFWPDAPANPTFPSIILRPGQVWEQVTEWRFAPG